MSGSLWTPTGDLTLDKDVVSINRQEIEMLARLESFAINQGLVIFCRKCEQPVVGHNGSTDRVLSVHCQCREWRYINPSV